MEFSDWILTASAVIVGNAASLAFFYFCVVVHRRAKEGLDPLYVPLWLSLSACVAPLLIVAAGFVFKASIG